MPKGPNLNCKYIPSNIIIVTARTLEVNKGPLMPQVQEDCGWVGGYFSSPMLLLGE